MVRWLFVHLPICFRCAYDVRFRGGTLSVAVGVRPDTVSIRTFDSAPSDRLAQEAPWWDFNVILRQIHAARDHTELNRLYTVVDMHARFLYVGFLVLCSR